MYNIELIRSFISGFCFRFDVTEAQFIVILICLISSVFGSHFWAFTIFGIELKIFAIIGALTFGAVQYYYYLVVVFTGGVGKNGSTVADSSILFPAWPLMMALIPLSCVYCRNSKIIKQFY